MIVLLRQKVFFFSLIVVVAVDHEIHSFIDSKISNQKTNYPPEVDNSSRRRDRGKPSRPLSKAQNIAAADRRYTPEILVLLVYPVFAKNGSYAKSAMPRDVARPSITPVLFHDWDSFHSLFTFIFISITYAVGGIIMNLNSQQFLK